MKCGVVFMFTHYLLIGLVYCYIFQNSMQPCVLIQYQIVSVWPVVNRNDKNTSNNKNVPRNGSYITTSIFFFKFFFCLKVELSFFCVCETNHLKWMRSHFGSESFCPFSFSSEQHFASSLLDKRRDKQRYRQKIRQAERKWHCCCSDRITVCFQLLFDRTHHHSYCWDESPILRGVLEQKSFRQLRKLWSGKSSSLDSWGPPWWLWGGSNNFNLSSFWLLSGHKLSLGQNFNHL